MLESEAKRKWCPMYRSDGDFDNRFIVYGEEMFTRNCVCLGNQCACWVDTGYDDAAKERTGRCGLAR